MLMPFVRKDILSAAARVPVVVLLMAIAATTAAARTGQGGVRVEVADSSGGRLPGVPVIATAVDGQVMTAVTDRLGDCIFPALPVGPAMLRFRLDRFAGVLTGVTVEAGTELRVVQRL